MIGNLDSAADGSDADQQFGTLFDAQFGSIRIIPLNHTTTAVEWRNPRMRLARCKRCCRRAIETDAAGGQREPAKQRALPTRAALGDSQ
jgi:hypothetical protein